MKAEKFYTVINFSFTPFKKTQNVRDKKYDVEERQRLKKIGFHLVFHIRPNDHFCILSEMIKTYQAFSS